MDMNNMGSGMDMNMDMMKMYFHTGYKEYVLFYEAHTQSQGAMVGACIAVFVLAVFYEGFKFLREELMRKMNPQQSMTVSPTTESVDNGSNWAMSQEKVIGNSRGPTWTEAMCSVSHVVQTFLHMIQIFVSYCLMLVFMTFNIYLCVAVVAGAGLGYYLFGWRRAVTVDPNEHCH